jgi:hypothetical protein
LAIHSGNNHQSALLNRVRNQNIPLSLSNQVKCSLLNVSNGINSAISLDTMLMSMTQGIETRFRPNPLCNDQKEGFGAKVPHEDEVIQPDVTFNRIASDTSD